MNAQMVDAELVDTEEQSTALAAARPAMSEDSSPAGMIAYAMRTNASIAELRELYEFKKQYDADEAKKAFQRAVAAFKANPPDIIRDKENKQFGSQYSSLSNLVNRTNEAMAPHGLSVAWTPAQNGNSLTITCVLTHEQGHSESVTLTAPHDTSGGSSKNAIQQMKSTATYLRGLTFEMVTGVATRDFNADDDGNGAGRRGTLPEAKDPEDTDQRRKLVADLYAKADEGVAALGITWNEIGADNRKMVGASEWAMIKAKAEGVGP